VETILQMKIFQKFSRELSVPTFIHKLTIDPKQHAIIVQQLETKNENVGGLNPFSLNEAVTFTHS